MLGGKLILGGTIKPVLLAYNMEGEQPLSQLPEDVVVFKCWALEVSHQEPVDARALDLGSVGIKLTIAIHIALIVETLSRLTSFSGALFNEQPVLLL
jgi:hypothetical protein